MSKIVILKGSPRKKGNSNKMADGFMENALSNGHDVEILDIVNMKIGGCRACNGCVDKKQCVFQDDFTSTVESLKTADGIVVATPVYWYTFPSQIKAFIDRWYSLYVSGYMFEGKKVALISCCEETTLDTFDGIKFSFEKTMALMKAEIVGEILIPGVVEVGDVDKTDGIEQAKELVEKFSI